MILNISTQTFQQLVKITLFFLPGLFLVQQGSDCHGPTALLLTALMHSSKLTDLSAHEQTTFITSRLPIQIKLTVVSVITNDDKTNHKVAVAATL